MSRKKRHRGGNRRPSSSDSSDRPALRAVPSAAQDDGTADDGQTPPAALPPGGIETLVGLIAVGHLDEHLPLLTRTINERLRQVAQARSIRALGSVEVGDRVRINHQVRPLYLHGATGTVAGWSGQRVVVLLDTPVGRFTSGEVRCPPLGLDPLGR